MRAAIALLSCFLATAVNAEGPHMGKPGMLIEEKDVLIERIDRSKYKPLDINSLVGTFDMLDHHGNSVSNKTWPDRWLVVTFGFPGCRESCPVALDTLSKSLELMGENAKRIQPLFVDVSMDRKPAPAAMKQFLSNFDERIVGLVGTRPQVNEMIRSFKIMRQYGMAGSNRETGPRINHTASLFIVDLNGRVRAVFPSDWPADKTVATIISTMNRSE